jgi:hypothetical protein
LLKLISSGGCLCSPARGTAPAEKSRCNCLRGRFSPSLCGRRAGGKIGRLTFVLDIYLLLTSALSQNLFFSVRNIIGAPGHHRRQIVPSNVVIADYLPCVELGRRSCCGIRGARLHVFGCKSHKYVNPESIHHNFPSRTGLRATFLAAYRSAGGGVDHTHLVFLS